ncbi:MAG: SDR family NAD(P)-dependent oxidoreductase [Kofleriaceae bacterium]|nr:SDR family NAD(P)-dependent oxidoreductase [Kofleriaceae bacterium]
MQIALVTGAGSATGIGAEVCRQLAASDFHVVLTARSPADAAARSRELGMPGIALDVLSAQSITDAVAFLHERFGKLDVLVNNAAGSPAFTERPSTAALTRAQAVMDVTLWGTWRVTQGMIPLLRKSTRGRVVNVSSGAGSHGDPTFGLHSENSMGPAYAVAKCALNALTVAFANELRGDRILVNAVCPGFTATFDGGEALGARPVQDGARSVVWAALLDDDGPTGGLFRDGQPLPW